MLDRVITLQYSLNFWCTRRLCGVYTRVQLATAVFFPRAGPSSFTCFHAKEAFGNKQLTRRAAVRILMGHAGEQKYSWLVAAASSEAYAQFSWQYQMLCSTYHWSPEFPVKPTSTEICLQHAILLQSSPWRCMIRGPSLVTCKLC